MEKQSASITTSDTMELNDYIGLNRAAKLLDCSEQTIYRMEARGDIQSYRIPGVNSRIYLREEVMRWKKVSAAA